MMGIMAFDHPYLPTGAPTPSRTVAAIAIGLAAAAVAAAAIAAASRPRRPRFTCARVSTRTQRAQWTATGVNMNDRHVAHVVSRANGGADHPFNYVPLDAALNMSLGARNDDVMCELVGPKRCRIARQVSRVCGTTNA